MDATLTKNGICKDVDVQNEYIKLSILKTLETKCPKPDRLWLRVATLIRLKFPFQSVDQFSGDFVDGTHLTLGRIGRMPPSSRPSSSTFRFFYSTSRIITLSIILRLVLIIYGIYHDAHSPLKYTDIDYFVFTDAARFVHVEQSPYRRETYRYTPLLAWLLLPNAWRGWEAWGKVIFALGDVAAGWIMILILRGRGMNRERSLKYSSIWLLNPMVRNCGF